MDPATLEWAGKLAYTRTRKHSNEAPTNTMMQHTRGHRMVRNAMSLLGVRLLGERISGEFGTTVWELDGYLVDNMGRTTAGAGKSLRGPNFLRQAALDDGLSGKDVRLAIASLFFLFLFLCHLSFSSFLIFITPSRTITRDLCKIPTKSFCFVYSHIKCIMFRQLVRL